MTEITKQMAMKRGIKTAVELYKKIAKRNIYFWFQEAGGVLCLVLCCTYVLGQDAIVSEISRRRTSPTGRSAFVHHRRKFPQRLLKSGNHYQSSLSDESSLSPPPPFRRELIMTSLILGVGSLLISLVMASVLAIKNSNSSAVMFMPTNKTG